MNPRVDSIDITVDEKSARCGANAEPSFSSTLNPKQNNFFEQIQINRQSPDPKNEPNDVSESIHTAQRAIRKATHGTPVQQDEWWQKSAADLTLADAQLAILSNTSGKTLQEATEEDDSDQSPKISGLHGSFLNSNEHALQVCDESVPDENSTVQQPSPDLTCQKQSMVQQSTESLPESVKNVLGAKKNLQAIRVEDGLKESEVDDYEDEIRAAKTRWEQGHPQDQRNHDRDIVRQQYFSQRATMEEADSVVMGSRLRASSRKSSHDNRKQSNRFLSQKNATSASVDSQYKSISGALAASLPKSRRDLYLENIMKLEDLIRSTSKEANPKPNYNRLMRQENKAEEYCRKKKEADEVPDFEKIEKEIIGNTVEQMLEKIKKKRHAVELVHLNQNFSKPLKYFQSMGAKKAQMHTQNQTLIGRQGRSNTTSQITRLLSEFSSVNKVSGQFSLIGAEAEEEGRGSPNARSKISQTASQIRKPKRPSSAMYSSLTANSRQQQSTMSRFRTRQMLNTQKSATRRNQNFMSSQPAQFFSTSPKNQDLPFKQFTRNSRQRLHGTAQGQTNTPSQLPRTKMLAQHRQFPATVEGTITHDEATVNSPQDSSAPNISVNINFNVSGNINIVNPLGGPQSLQRDPSEDGNQVKSSLRRSASGANKNFIRDRRNNQDSVGFDVKFLRKAYEDAQQDKQQLRQQSSEKRLRRSARPMSAAVHSSNKIFRKKNFFSPKGQDASSNMNSSSHLNQGGGAGGGLYHRGAGGFEAHDIMRQSSASRLNDLSNPNLLQVSSRNQLDVRKKAEDTFDKKKTQTVPLKTYFEQNIMITQSLDELDEGDDDPRFKSTQKSLLRQAKLFQQIYYSNKHINAQAAPVDMDLAEKEPTLPKDLVFALFNAKFTDLKLMETEDQFARFQQQCIKRNYNGNLTFTDVKLSIHFARAFSDIMFRRPDLRITHINLERNFLRDVGAIMIVQSLVETQSLIYLNLASNEIQPKGVNQILELLIPNESIQELIIGSSDEGCGILNRTNSSIAPVLENFVVQNRSVCMLSLRGMGLTIDCLTRVFQRLREAYKQKQAEIEAEERCKTKELEGIEEEHYRDDGENTALTLLMKTKRRYRKAVVDNGPINKLSLQSLDLANNDLRLTVGVQKLFQEAVGYSDLHKLDLSNNKIGNDGINVVAGSLQYRSQLRSLAVANCNFNLEGGNYFLRELSKNPHIEHAVIDKNNLSGTLQRQKVLKDLFFNNKKMKYISLAHCNVGQTGAAQISRGIGFSLNLAGVNLAGNNFGNQGATDFADCVMGYQFALKYLNLAENKISDAGGKKLTAAFIGNKTLHVVDLRHNNLGERTASAFKQIAKMNPMLTKVYLEYNLINIKQIEDVTEMTQANLKRQDRRNLNEIRKQARNLKKGVSKVSFQQNSKDEAFQELEEQMDVAKEIFGQYQEKVDELEQRLLFLQDHPDEKIQKMKQVSKILRVQKLDCLKREEDDIDRQLREAREVFKFDSQIYSNRIEDSEHWRLTNKPKLERLQKMLNDKKAVMDGEKLQFVEEAERIESIVQNRMLRYDLMQRDLQRELDRQEKVRLLKEKAEKDRAAAEDRRKREDAKNKSGGGKSKSAGKRKASTGGKKKGKKGKKS